MIQDFIDEYRRYRALGERAVAQAPDAALNHVPGNLVSRFTDFLVAVGEKPWREREDEFAERQLTREKGTR